MKIKTWTSALEASPDLPRNIAQQLSGQINRGANAPSDNSSPLTVYPAYSPLLRHYHTKTDWYEIWHSNQLEENKQVLLHRKNSLFNLVYDSIKTQ